MLFFTTCWSITNNNFLCLETFMILLSKLTGRVRLRLEGHDRLLAYYIDVSAWSPFVLDVLMWKRSLNVYKHLSRCCYLRRILSWIHKDNALPGHGPMCSAVPHYHTVWWKSHLTPDGLKLPLCWQTATVFWSTTTSVNCVCISFLLLRFGVNYVLRDVLWQTASPREVHFRHH